MKVNKVIPNIKIRPTEKKLKKTEKTIDEFAALPKDMPLDKDVYIRTEADAYEDAKNRILISLSDILRSK